METVIRIETPEALRQGASAFIKAISESPSESNIIAFYGRMGAGKTTFIKALCGELGVKDIVNSPTFTIVNEYRSDRGFPVYHFDFYRIDKLSEAYDIGIDEYFSGEGLCLIEWPEKIEEILPEESFRVIISVDGDGSRVLRIRSSI